jgi:predicted transcriptional regulator
MNINKANEITKVVNKINKCESFLKSLDGHSYPDEFVIYYRGIETCELEESALNLLIEYYKQELENAKQELNRL